MKFNSIMHIAFYVEDLDRSLDFYCKKLGLKQKIRTRFGVYKDSPKEELRKIAEVRPNDIFLTYIEIAPGQFIELFPKSETQKNQTDWNAHVGYSHFALLVDDIQQTYQDLLKHGVEVDVPPNIGPSKTWQMWLHDPDGNKFEIMQYTEESLQIIGNV
jgi:lactoylglutathione lyase